MVQILKFQADENISDKLFEPKKKYTLLVSGKDIVNGYFTVPECARWDPRISAHFNIYEWELLLTGTIDFGKKSPLNLIDFSNYNYKNNKPGKIIKKISRAEAETFVHAVFHDDLNLYSCGKRKQGGYKEAVKIWPGLGEVLPEFEKAVERLADLSDKNTLTTIIIFSHGENGSIQMGSSQLEYKKMLESFDEIRGKKAVFVYACNSGSFLQTLKTHKKRRNYAAIVSCEANKLSTNIDDCALDDYLFAHFSKGKSYSDLKLKKVEYAHYKQHPQLLRYFDVQLI